MELSDLRPRRLIGRGGSSDVFEVVHVPTGQTLALKVLSAGLESEREVDCRYANAMPVFACGEVDARVHVVMPYYRRGDLSSAGALSERTARIVAAQVAARFDDYQMFRADVLARWEAGDDTAATHGTWQGALWRRLRAPAHRCTLPLKALNVGTIRMRAVLALADRRHVPHVREAIAILNGTHPEIGRAHV